MKKNNIVLITGKKQSGKDTVASFFKADGFLQISFATALKNLSNIIFREFFDLNEEWDWETDEGKNKIIPFANNKKKITYRQWLQKLGTEFFREQISETYWVDTLCDSVSHLITDYNIVIPDIRFENEFLQVKKRFKDIATIYLIKVERGEVQDFHSSETSMDSLPDDCYDFVIKNNFVSIDELYHYVRLKLFPVIWRR